MALTFKKASKSQARLRLALSGGPGDGKTWSALTIATHLVPGGRIAVIDTEHGSAAKYANLFEFDALELDSFSPALYIEAIQVAEKAKYDVIIIDSLSHAWAGKDGALEQKDRAASRTGNSWTAWRDITPLHNAMIEAIVGCRSHVIATLRAKVEYVQEAGEGGRKASIRRLGMSPVQREGVDFEFDVVGMLNTQHEMEITKSRCPDLSGKYFSKPGEEFAGILRAWLTDGTPAPEPKPRVELPIVTTARPREVATVGEPPQDVIDDCGQFDMPLVPEQAAAVYHDHIGKMTTQEKADTFEYLLAKTGGKSADFQRAIAFEQWRIDAGKAHTVEELEAIYKDAKAATEASHSPWGKKTASEALAQLAKLCSDRKKKLLTPPPEPPNGGGAPKPETAPSDTAVNGAAMQSPDANAEDARLRAALEAIDNREHLARHVAAHEHEYGLPEDVVTTIALNRFEQLGQPRQVGRNMLTAARHKRAESSKKAA